MLLYELVCEIYIVLGYTLIGMWKKEERAQSMCEPDWLVGLQTFPFPFRVVGVQEKGEEGVERERTWG